MKSICLLITLVLIFSSRLVKSNEEGDENNVEDMMKTLPKKMLARRREEHLALLKGVALNPKYEWRYKLVEIGVTKVFELLIENKEKIMKEKGSDNFIEPRMLVLENSCLLMDFIVNFNPDIYAIMNKVAKKKAINWKELISFIFENLEKEKDMLDDLTTREYEFIRKNMDNLINEKELPEYELENSIRRDIIMAERKYKNEKKIQKDMKSNEKKKKRKKGPLLNQIP